MFQLLKGAFAAIAIFSATTAQSANFLFDVDGRLTGVDGLFLPAFSSSITSGTTQVDDSYWNVRFEKGSCTEAFGFCDQSYVGNLQLDVVAAGLATSRPLDLRDSLIDLLISEVLVDRAEGNFRSDRNAISGCNLPGTCQILSFPLLSSFGTDARLFFTTLLNGRISSTFSIPQNSVRPEGYDLTTPLQVYAVFSLGEAPVAPAPVPLPASALLLGAGLTGFGLMRRRR